MDGGSGSGGRPSLGGGGQFQQPPPRQQQKQHKLTNRYEQDVQVAFPLRPMAEEGQGGGDGEGKGKGKADAAAAAGPWLSEEDYQAYSVRGATDKWRDGLRRRVGLYKLMAAHPNSDLVRAIFEPRGSRAAAAAGGASGGGRQQQHRGGGGGREEGKGGGGGGKRRRGWEDGKLPSLYGDEGRGGGAGSDDEDEDEDNTGARAAASGSGSGAVVGRMIKLGPVAKTRNSSLTLAEHRSYLLLSRKQARFESGEDSSARPLTSEERQALQRLDPVVRAEQAKYLEALRKWVEAGRSPYKLLEKALGPAVDAYVAELKARQKRALPRRYQRHFASPMAAADEGALLMPAPAYRDTVKAARPREGDKGRGVLVVPGELPVDIPKDHPLRLSDATAHRLVDRMAGLGSKDWVFEDADVLIDLPTILALADPAAAWTVPFTVRALNGSGTSNEEAASSSGSERKVLVLRSPLLPPVLSMRARANLYYAEAVPAALRRLQQDASAASSDAAAEAEAAAAAADVDPAEDPCLSLEALQLAQLRVVVATDRVALSVQGGGSEAAAAAAPAQEASLEVDVDYALEWSEEEEDMPMQVIRPLVHAAFASGAAPYVAKVDGKASKLARVAPREGNPALMANPRFISDVVARLSRVLGLLLAQPRGNYVARHEPGAREMTVYLQAASETEDIGADGLDLHAAIDASAQADAAAASSYRKWVWPSQGNDHIPGTFVPRT